MAHDLFAITSVNFPVGTGTRVVSSATAASTAEAAIPTGGNCLIIRAVDVMCIRFGASGVGAAANDANSILFPGGEAFYKLKPGDAVFRCIRIGTADVPIQLESAIIP